MRIRASAKTPVPSRNPRSFFQRFPRRASLQRQSRGGPDRVAADSRHRRGGHRLVFGTEVVESGVQVVVLERDVAHQTLALVVARVMIVVVDEMRSKPTQHGHAPRQRPDRAAEFNRLLVVDFDPLVVLAVIDADVEIAVVRREVVVEGHARISGRHGCRQRDTLREHGPLEPVAVDALFEIDPRRLLDSQPDPGSPRHPVVEIELRVRVLDSKDETVVRHAAAGSEAEQPALPGDVGCDAKGHDMGDVAGDVDVGALNVERVPIDAVAVRVRDVRLCLQREAGEEGHPHPDRRRVVGRGIAGGRGDLRGDQADRAHHGHGQESSPGGHVRHTATITRP